jgi:hypothetical protein
MPLKCHLYCQNMMHYENFRFLLVAECKYENFRFLLVSELESIASS